MSAESDDRSQRALAAAVGGMAGAAVGGPIGAIVGSAGGVLIEPLIEKVWGEVQADGRRRATSVVEAAAELSNTDVYTFAEYMSASESSRLLAGSAISTATRTTSDPKLRALARALAAGLAEDCARVDEEQLFIAALADFEAPHALLLDLLGRHRLGIKEGEDGRGVYVAERLDEGLTAQPTWRVKHMAMVRPGMLAVLPGLLGTLQRHGLAAPEDNLAKTLEEYGKEVAKETQRAARSKSSSTATPRPPTGMALRRLVPDASWRVTDHGLQLLDYLDAEGSQPPGARTDE